MYENLDFFGFLEAKLRENRRLPQTRPQKSESMQKFGKFWYMTLMAPSGAYMTLKHLPIYPIKSTYQGTNFASFHVHPGSSGFHFWALQKPKDQGYPKVTKKVQIFDLAQTPKMSFFGPKHPTVQQHGNSNLQWTLVIMS